MTLTPPSSRTLSSLLLLLSTAACGGTGSPDISEGSGGNDAPLDGSPLISQNPPTQADDDITLGSNGDGDDDSSVSGDGDEPNSEGDPDSCRVAGEHRTYVGCEFWPTISYNPLYEDFDFAVVLANGSDEDAEVTVTGGALGEDITDVVPAGGLKAIVLPWVPELKGPEFSRVNTSEGRATSSVRVDGGAYRVRTSAPVTAWQFNPLQFQKSGVDGCNGSSFGTEACFSVSNDASLLIPTTAMTQNYRVFGRSGRQTGVWGDAPGGMVITATENNTTVDVQLSHACHSETSTWGESEGPCIAEGPGVKGAQAGDVVTYTLNEGDVLQLLGSPGQGDGMLHADVSGSLVQSSAKVQVISFNPITNIPDPSSGNADHVEELVLPAEVLGNTYVVAPPSNPDGEVHGGHIVRIYGNVDGTTLTYEGQTPVGAPSSINAGEVVEVGPVTGGFEVTGSAPFAVGSFMLGGSLQSTDPACPNYPCSGDPAFSMMVTPEQFRDSYTFLAPTDYDANYADVLIPSGATVLLDGETIEKRESMTDEWSIARVLLDNTTGGVHRLESDVPVGLQVVGFGHATSYYYPGGLNLDWISEPPPPVVVR